MSRSLARETAGTRRVVILCGLMGTGKSAVGAALAERLGLEFIDTDELVAARAGKSIAEIFDQHGEAHFRALEADVCRDLDPSAGAVIATGGGMVAEPRNFERLQSMGTTVLLEASLDAMLERAGGAGNRPLLAGGEAAARRALESLRQARQPVYRRCELSLDTSRRSVGESAHDLMEMLEGHPERSVIPLRVDTRPLPGRPSHAGNTRLSRIVVGRGVSLELGAWLDRLGTPASVCFLAPARVADLVLSRVTPSLDERAVPWRRIDLEDGDAHKNMGQVSRLLDALAAAGANRDTVVATVGGGVTSDIGGFAASIYMRGLPVVHVPTSLLAQVDASIGGKVGVNHPRAKNLIGTIHQPHLVLVDPGLLETLPPREMANGMAEVVKTAIIGSPDLFELVAHVSESAAPSPDGIDDVVAQCVRVKAQVVERDPYEADTRRVLNLGHTLGHALESALAYAGLKHGEAVGLGLLAAWRVAIARGVAEPAWLERTRHVLGRWGLPTEAPAVDEGALRDALGLDKKRHDGTMVFVLPIAPGRVDIVDDVTERELLAAMHV